ANVTPNSAGTWSSSNTSVASITNAGLVTSLTVGSVTLTYTRTADGCSNSTPFTVNASPSSPVIGTITQPTCTTPTGSVILSGLPSTGNWTITRSPGLVTYSGTGTSYTVTSLPNDNTYTFSVTNQNNCVSNSSTNVVINDIPSTPTLGGDDFVCVGLTGNVTPTTNGTWSSSNSTIASVTSTGVVTGNTPGMVILTFTRNSNGCSATKEFTVSALPNAPIVGVITQPNCSTTTGSVVLNGLPSLGSWTLTRSPGNVTYTGSGSSYTVNSLTANTSYTFTVRNMYNCTSTSSSNVAILAIPTSPSVNIDYLGSVCLTANKQISGTITGGVSPYYYNWTGPSGFIGSTQNISITNNGNYYLTITDSNFCTAVTSGYIYESYSPLIVSLNTEVCEGQSATLNINSSSAISYQWSSNANNTTTSSVTVIPTFPSSTYQVTVTNDLGCTAVPSITINVIAKPIVSISGPNEICEGETSEVSPTTGGTWISTNPSVALVNQSGIVTGVSGGTATFIYTSSTTNCVSNPTTAILVNPKPNPVVTGPSNICIGSTTTLSPTTGGSWYSTNPSVATVTNEGIVTGIGQGSVQFYFIESTFLCTSNLSETIAVDNISDVILSGQSQACISTNIVLSATVPGGVWTSSNPSIATINNSGIVTGVSPGTVNIMYNYNAGSCSSQGSKEIIIHPKPNIQLNGENEICVGDTTSFTPNINGVWTSSNSSIASITNSGLVTGLQVGYATFTYQDDVTGCISDASSSISVQAAPTLTLIGSPNICIGGTTSFLPSSGGNWTSSNPSVASISNDGIVTGFSVGSAYFTFTPNGSSCTSTSNMPINVGSIPTATLDFHGSVCLTDTSKISVIPSGGTPLYSYNWVGPLGFTATSPLVNISNNGTYYVTVTDNYGCKANVSGYIYQRFEPYMVNLSTTVCQGQNVQLSVNAPSATAYLWSSNANNANTPNVTVVPLFPSSIYYVTVTNAQGCNAIANANILVNAKPEIFMVGPSPICVGQSTNMSPTTGGTWVSLNPSVATINNAGVVSSHAAGSVRFLFSQTSTGCISDTSSILNISATQIVSLNGPSSICIGSQTQLNPGTGGIWTSSNPTIANVNSSGLVTGYSPGVASFSFVNYVGCLSSNTINVTVHDNPSIVLNGQSQICVGSTTQFLPSTGGTWTSTNIAVATINNAGLVTGITPGTSRFLYTNSFTGCTSDSSVVITIISGVPVVITGSNPICVGFTSTLSPSSGGTWISNHPSIASVTNSGVVTGLSQGTATFTFTQFSTGCPSLPTEIMTINPRPSVEITGPNNICIGGTSTLTPFNGGVWSSSNPAIATVTNGGLITGISTGLANFTFTQSSTGCISLPTSNIVVIAKPSITLGTSSICIGSTTTLQPNSGGTWISLNPTVASVNNSGIVSGISAGTAQFTFTSSSTGCTSNPSTPLTVLPKPGVSITGPSTICQGFTSQLSPTTGGNWVSLNPNIATVTNSGLVVGISNGTAQFVFTSNQGCVSDPTGQLTVNGKPIVSISGPPNICIGNTTQLNPSSGGNWVSGNPSIATVSVSGLVTGVATGNVKFIFTNTTTGCVSDSSSSVTIHSKPMTTLIGNPNICIGHTSQLSPTVGGTWTSLNPTIATVSNTGLVTGMSAGQASFKFVQTSTGCESTVNNIITVLPRPTVQLTGTSMICIGNTTTLTPSTGGSWASLNIAIATITNAGIVTGVGPGTTQFVFTSLPSGCTSLPSVPVSVLPKPSTILNGSPQICIGGNTQFIPNSGGTWTSLNPSIAIISNTGLVTGISPGSAQFMFTDLSTGCVSNPTTPVMVNAPINVSVSGPTSICLGYNTTLSASASGIWYSTRSDIATTTTNGFVTGIAPGKVSFYFVESSTGCISYLPDDFINVTQCIDPDFNVTMVNVPVNGNVFTNDEVPLGTTYLNTVYLLSKPDQSTSSLVMNTNGTYTFQANLPGIYAYHIMICLPGMSINCPMSTLVFTVINPNLQEQSIVPNLDLVYTYENYPVIIQTIQNDKCIAGSSCAIDPSLILMEVHPNNGNASLMADGSIQYTPASNFIGMDTIYYKVCAGDNNNHCLISRQIITVMANNANNALAASDDFFVISKGQSLNNGKLLTNDKDPEQGEISIVPFGSIGAPINISNGSYYITSEGELFFTPVPSYTGPVDITYIICDPLNHCVKATAHILVLDNLKLRIRAYLEGPLMENANAIGTNNRPLMRDNLRFSPYTGSNHIPSSDPYSYPTTYFDISYRYTHVGMGAQSQWRNIPNPAAVFAVVGENAIVDWVFIELRSPSDSSLILATRSALIQRDGDVVDLDGVSPVEFPGIKLDSCYIVLNHRNHFAVMSQVVSTSDILDFTSPLTPTFDFGNNNNEDLDYTGLAQKADVIPGYMAMWGGDFDGNGRIKFVNPDDDQNFLFFEVLSFPANLEFMANFNFVYGYLQGDFDLNGKAKYDNPDDDKNMLFYQVLFHPLNYNFISNFNFIIQQVPLGRIN
ncbi:MAG: Ig-like domain-containing protein, partial [Saprospiraceae bacterium]